MCMLVPMLYKLAYRAYFLIRIRMSFLTLPNWHICTRGAYMYILTLMRTHTHTQDPAWGHDSGDLWPVDGGRGP